MKRTWERDVWSIELKAEDRLEDQQGHGYSIECGSGYGRT